MKRTLIYLAAIGLLCSMAFSLLQGAKNDSATSDELAHLDAGYTYVTLHDYRLNPEHPPLLKDLAGLSLSTIHPSFPLDYYQSHLAQYDVAHKFFFHNGNDPERMLYYGRLPAVALTLLLGLFVFLWSVELNGSLAGLASLALFAFDPNLIAHGHLITQDMPLATMMVINLYFVWKYFKSPSRVLLGVSGITFGLALLAKFSAPVLLLIYGIIAVYAAKRNVTRTDAGRLFSNLQCQHAERKGRFAITSFAWIAAIGAAVMFVGFFANMYKMPVAVQTARISALLPADAPIMTWMATTPLRPLSQYLLGFSLVKNHVAVGHGIYLLGKMTSGSYLYYPLTFVLKTTIPVLIIMAAFPFLRKLLRQTDAEKTLSEFILLAAFFTFGFIIFAGKLDLGIRYLLPAYPLFYIYAGKIVRVPDGLNAARFFRQKQLKPLLATACLVGLLAWQAASCLRIAPYYLSYFNEFVGPVRGGEIVADSNIDWGQDFRRLKTWADKEGIERIYVDYFGGEEPKYYFGKRARLWSEQKKGRPKGWFAVSVNNYVRARASGNYAWLDQYQPVERIGYSILVFKLPD